MLYKQITDFCSSELGLEPSEISGLRSEAEKTLSNLRRDEAAGKLPIISLAREVDDLAEIESFAKNIRDNFDVLAILGTGGSSLCGQAVAGFAQGAFSNASPKVVFLQNIDPQTFDDFFTSVDLKRTAFLAISKSGQSVETLMQLLICLEQAKSKKLEIKKHFFSIAMPGDNALRRISAEHDIKVYDHDPNVGGRFSILSLVGLMPGVVAGIDASKFRKGAAEFFKNHADLAVESAILHINFMRKNIWQSVMMTYPDRLEDFNIWYRQIWAESIGKNGTGSTPIKSMGTIDQHSQMQLYLAGRRDKFYSFITLECEGDKFKLGNVADKDLGYLSNKTLGDLINAEQKATVQTLCDHKRPVRRIELKKLDDEVFGMLTMHLMLETILTSHLLGVNPYDQPAVEAGKIKTREILASS